MDSAAARSAGTLLEALLLAQVLAPLADDAGAFGSYGTLFMAQRIAQSDAAGFGAAVARSLERAR